MVKDNHPNQDELNNACCVRGLWLPHYFSVNFANSCVRKSRHLIEIGTGTSLFIVHPWIRLLALENIEYARSTFMSVNDNFPFNVT